MSEANVPPNHYWHRDVLLSVQFPKDHVDRLLDNFQFRENDIVLVTYPRSGTLLTQEMIWQTKQRRIIKPGETYGSLFSRFPYIEIHIPAYTSLHNCIDLLEKKPETEQRFIKTHLPPHVIFDRIKNCKKIVMVYRDAKDVAASYFNFYKSLTDFEDWPSSWDEFFQHFVDGNVMYGSLFKWNAEWLKLKHLPNIHVIKYEEIANDKRVVIKRLAEFLDEAEITDEQITAVVENTSFKQMSLNKDVNIKMQNESNIMRKGIVGDYKNFLSKEQEELIDSLTEKYIKPQEK